MGFGEQCCWRWLELSSSKSGEQRRSGSCLELALRPRRKKRCQQLAELGRWDWSELDCAGWDWIRGGTRRRRIEGDDEAGSCGGRGDWARMDWTGPCKSQVASWPDWEQPSAAACSAVQCSAVQVQSKCSTELVQTATANVGRRRAGALARDNGDPAAGGAATAGSPMVEVLGTSKLRFFFVFPVLT